MAAIKKISAVIFDMDGTLVDSEIYTGQVVRELCAEFGIEKVDIDCSDFDGVSWQNIGSEIVSHYPALSGRLEIPRRLHEIYHRMLRDYPPRPINQAREAVIAASDRMPTAIVSSSHRESIAETIERMDIAEYIRFYAGAEDYDRQKPAPDGYLKVAQEFQIAPRECLVFEDSVVGIKAARSAGMQVIAITQGAKDVSLITGIAHRAISDYSELEEGFFDDAAK